MIKKALTHVALFVILAGGFLIWLATLSDIDKIYFMEDILNFFGFDTKYYNFFVRFNGPESLKVQLQSTLEKGALQMTFAYIVIIVMATIVPIFLSFCILSFVDIIFRNKDTKTYYSYNKKMYFSNGNNFLRSINFIFYLLFIFTSLFGSVVIVRSMSLDSSSRALLLHILFIFVLYIVQVVLLKLIEKIVFNVSISIKNKKAWR